MFYLGSTRFNTCTWIENQTCKKKEKIKGAIYGVSIKINDKYPLNSLIFVIEMNNDNNEIYGISLIRNSIVTDKKYPMYDNNDYNRFIYKGEYWIDREEILTENRIIIEMIENMVFKGKSHLKRQSGISIITSKLFSKWKYDETFLKHQIKELFILKFKNINNTL
jgi:hypothetical protein